MVKPCSRRGGGGYLSAVLTEDDKGRLSRGETVSSIGRPCRNFVEVSCRRRAALRGFEDWREMLKSSANRLWVKGKETHSVMSLMASRKSGTLHTSP